ncbi:MAG: hypothetical protein ACFFE1_16670 [Candidatus Thorarchaeota archaeon]
MVKRSRTTIADRKKIGPEYLISSGYGILFIHTNWLKHLEQIKRFAKHRKKRSKIDKWRFK